MGWETNYRVVNNEICPDYIYTHAKEFETIGNDSSIMFKVDYIKKIVEDKVNPFPIRDSFSIILPIPKVYSSVMEKITKTMKYLFDEYKVQTNKIFEGEVMAGIVYSINDDSVIIKDINFLNSLCLIKRREVSIVAHSSGINNCHYHSYFDKNMSRNDIDFSLNRSERAPEHAIITYDYDKNLAELWFHYNFRINNKAVISIAPKPRIIADEEYKEITIIPKVKSFMMEEDALGRANEAILTKFNNSHEWVLLGSSLEINKKDLEKILFLN